MEPPYLGSEPRQEQRYIRAACIDMGRQGFDSDWPTRFQYPPRIGELVKNVRGEIAKIAKVIHIQGADGPIVLLEITRDLGGSTPVEGSGGTLT